LLPQATDDLGGTSNGLKEVIAADLDSGNCPNLLRFTPLVHHGREEGSLVGCRHTAEVGPLSHRCQGLSIDILVAVARAALDDVLLWHLVRDSCSLDGLEALAAGS
jgi:hypothetical protein